MNNVAPLRPALSTAKPISLAILAMGGQGGGVLADWIVALGEAQGWHVQSTSVPGVAQRTGATIYYIEMLKTDGRQPTLSLMPMPGDVDIVLAAELMEAGRSMLRGLVTPERTVLIASTHRSLAVSEKSSPGDGEGDPDLVRLAAGTAAKRVIAFDMQSLAERAGSVISAAMFGALAGSGRLPFERDAFEAAVRAGGKGVEPSLRAFSLGFEAARRPVTPRPLRKGIEKRFAAVPEQAGQPVLDALLARIRTGFPEGLHPMLFAGVRRLVAYQDPAYAAEYLDLVAPFVAQGLGEIAAKYIAVAMAYDDVIRVADLKTTASRLARVQDEMAVTDRQLLATTEFMHPRGEEVVGLLPAGTGRWIMARPGLFRLIDRVVNRPRRVRTHTIFWFCVLYAVAGLRRHRRGTLRHAEEMAHRDAWLAEATRLAPSHPGLAAEVLAARRLVKGYSDTHARGLGKFDRVMAAVPLLEVRADGADWMRRLVLAAQADEHGKALDGALRTIATLDVS